VSDTQHRVRPRRVVALGYQGFANVGDEAILTGIETLLGDQPVTVIAIVCGPTPQTVVAFPAARRISSPRLLPTAAALRALWKADGLILSGGGLIQDYWMSVMLRYLAWIVLARALGKHVVWVGVGVGPLRRRSARVIARLSARLSTLALVRDPLSLDLIGGARAGVGVVPDPALFNSSPSHVEDRGNELPIIVRGPAPSATGEAGSLADIVVDLCVAARQRGWHPVLLTMAAHMDAAFVAEIRVAAARREEDVEIKELGPSPAAAIERLAGSHGSVAVRLHGLLLSAVAGVPCVPVAYDAKVRSAAVELGIGDLVVDPTAMTAEGVLDRLEMATTDARRAWLEDGVQNLRDRMPEVAAMVLAALGGAR